MLATQDKQYFVFFTVDEAELIEQMRKSSDGDISRIMDDNDVNNDADDNE
jgi:hypothetical protein